MDERENCKDVAHSPQVVVWRLPRLTCSSRASTNRSDLVVARSAQGLTAETVVVALEGTKTIKHSRRLSSRITTLETCGGVRAGVLARIAVVAHASCHHQIDRLNARTKLLQYWK
jgi:hypothetical protein